MNTHGTHYSDEMLRAAVEKHGPDVGALQRETGCSRATAYRRLKKLANGSMQAPKPEDTTDFSALVPRAIPGRIGRPIDDEVELAWTTNQPIFLVGETGAGKSAIAQQVAHDAGLPYLRVPCDAGTDFQELLGSLTMHEGSVFFREGQLLRLIQVPSIVLLDEVNALDQTKVFLLHQLLDSRTVFIKENGRTYRMDDSSSLFLAGNPPSHSYSVDPVSAALASRCLCIEVPPFSPSQVNEALTNKHPDLPKDRRKLFVRFYEEMQRFGNEQDVRARISMRDADRFALLHHRNGDVKTSLRNSFLNGVLLTDGPETKEACENIAATVFGALWQEGR
jgi:MoxR-like ATPase